MALETAVAVDAGLDESVEHVLCHAPEAELEASLLDIHVDKSGRHAVQRDSYIGVMCLC